MTTLGNVGNEHTVRKQLHVWADQLYQAHADGDMATVYVCLQEMHKLTDKVKKS